MKRFQSKQIRSLGQSISLAVGSRITLLISVFFFLTGISTGIFMELTMSSGEKSSIAGYLQQYLYMDQGTMEYPNPFFSSLSNNLLLLLIIFLSGLSAFGFPAALAALTYKGMALGFCTGLIAETLKDQGPLVILTSLAPQNLFLLPAFILASAAAVNYAFLSLRKKRAAKRNLKDFSGSYFLVILLLGAVIALGCGLEAVLYPVVLSP